MFQRHSDLSKCLDTYGEYIPQVLNIETLIWTNIILHRERLY